MAGLLKYFKRTQKKDSTLPDPDGPLSRDIPFSSIRITNTRVRQVQQEASSERRSRGPYILLTTAQKFSVGTKAAENGVTATLRYYSKTFPDLALKEATVRTLKTTICCISITLLAQQIYKSYLAKSVEDLF